MNTKSSTQEFKKINLKQYIDSTILFSRGSVVRNIKGYPFVPSLSQEEKNTLFTEISTLIKENNQFNLHDFQQTAKKSIPAEYQALGLLPINKKKGNPLLLVTNELQFSILINEIDHIQINHLLPGLNLGENYKNLVKLMNHLNQRFSFISSIKYGYLSPKLNHCGLGLNFTVLVNIPGIANHKKFQIHKENLKKRGYL
ncbi:MAG: hypothetical protein MJB14_23455, partial [Spirochaetes bacterium]|nr:hypothetical protein [Spirochaetota bacterium]